MNLFQTRQPEIAALLPSEILHGARIYRYKYSVFGNIGAWKECWLVLMRNGQLILYNDKHCRKQKAVFERDVVGKIKIGLCAEEWYNENIPAPPFRGNSLHIVIPGDGPDDPRSSKCHWLYAKSDINLEEWIESFAEAIGKRDLLSIIRSKITNNIIIDVQYSVMHVIGTINTVSVQTDWGSLWNDLICTSAELKEESVEYLDRSMDSSETSDEYPINPSDVFSDSFGFNDALKTALTSSPTSESEATDVYIELSDLISKLNSD